MLLIHSRKSGVLSILFWSILHRFSVFSSALRLLDSLKFANYLDIISTWTIRSKLTPVTFSKDNLILSLCLRIHICLQMESEGTRGERASCHVTHHVRSGGVEETWWLRWQLAGQKMIKENGWRGFVAGRDLPVALWLVGGLLLDLNHVLHVIGRWEGHVLSWFVGEGELCFHGCEFFLYFSGKLGLFGHAVFGLAPLVWSCSWRLTGDQLKLPLPPL